MSETSDKTQIPGASPDLATKTIFEETTGNAEQSKGVKFSKSISINLGANKVKTDSNDEREDRAGESAPLLPTPEPRWSWCDKLWLVTFVIMVAAGVTVGAFLLIWLGYESSHYHLIVKSKWTTIYPEREMVRLKFPLHDVSFVELNASDVNVCGDDSLYVSCVKLIQKKHMTEMNEPDILYNFIVDQDGTIYEGRGWDNCTCNGEFSEEDLTIGILVNGGSIGRKVPMYVRNFLRKAEDKLYPCFNITLHNSTAALNPVLARAHEAVNMDKC